VNADAVVIGSGPNGLVAANLLADAGWDVIVLEEAEMPGGAVRSGELTIPGYTHDLFSSFYPLAAASKVIRGLQLEEFGLRWRRGPLVLAHPAEDGSCPVLGSLEETLASLEPGERDGWTALTALWDDAGPAFMDGLTSSFPPVGAAVRGVKRLGPVRSLDFARFLGLPLRRMTEEFGLGRLGARLLGGNAVHADFSPETPGSAAFAWVLVGLARSVGFPVAEGGAGSLSGAMIRRLEARGGILRCGQRVDAIEVRGGRAVGVRLADGSAVAARRAVVADVGAPQLYERLLDASVVPSSVRNRIERFQYDWSTVKVDWALREPIPWAAPDAGRAPVIHVAEGLDELTRSASAAARRTVPARPFLVMGQYSMVDPTRQPDGAETAWAYTHIPQRIEADEAGQVTGEWDDADERAMADRVEERIERLAPGFRDRIAARHVFTPRSMERANRNLVGGAINGGTAQLHQQLVFRPIPGLRRHSTPIAGLYLASASTHPGGGVHGACGANAARAALSLRERTRVAIRSRR
jgi:phytoene dehydrogenase-like protein